MLLLIFITSITLMIPSTGGKKKSGLDRLRKATSEKNNVLMCPINYAVHKINLDDHNVFCVRLNETFNPRNDEYCSWGKNCDLFKENKKNMKVEDRLTNNIRIPRGARIKENYIEFYCCKEQCRYATCMLEVTTKRNPSLIVPKDGVPRFIVKASSAAKKSISVARFKSCKILCSSGAPAQPGSKSGALPIPLVIGPCQDVCDKTKKPDACPCTNDDDCESNFCGETTGLCLTLCPVAEGGLKSNCPRGVCIVLVPDIFAVCLCYPIGVEVTTAALCCSNFASGSSPSLVCAAPGTCATALDCFPFSCSCATGECSSTSYFDDV